MKAKEMTFNNYQRPKQLSTRETIARILIFGAAGAGALCLLLSMIGILPPLPSIADDLRELAAIFRH